MKRSGRRIVLLSVLAVVVAGLTALVVIAGVGQTPDPTRSASADDAPGSETPPLELLSAECAVTGSGGFVECSGVVRNLTQRSISNIQVLVLWEDSAGVPRRSDYSFIDIDPLLGGQTSTWGVFASYDSGLRTFTVHFLTPSGEYIEHLDRRP